MSRFGEKCRKKLLTLFWSFRVSLRLKETNRNSKFSRTLSETQSESERLKKAQIDSKNIFLPNDQKCRDLVRNVEKNYWPFFGPSKLFWHSRRPRDTQNSQEDSVRHKVTQRGSKRLRFSQKIIFYQMIINVEIWREMSKKIIGLFWSFGVSLWLKETNRNSKFSRRLSET